MIVLNVKTILEIVHLMKYLKYYLLGTYFVLRKYNGYLTWLYTLKKLTERRLQQIGPFKFKIAHLSFKKHILKQMANLKSSYIV